MTPSCVSFHSGEWEVLVRHSGQHRLAVTSLMVPAAVLIWRCASALNLLQLGEEEAHYLGVDVALGSEYYCYAAPCWSHGGCRRQRRDWLCRTRGAAPDAHVAGAPITGQPSPARYSQAHYCC